MKTLYLSDLDGTLLGTDDRVSAADADTINRLIADGMMFSYATARSFSSAGAATSGVDIRLPVIIYNGAFIVDPVSEMRLVSHLFSRPESEEIIRTITEQGIYPLVYAYVDGAERVTWLAGSENEGIRYYLRSREGDARLRKVYSEQQLYEGEIFYFTCIGARQDLIPAYYTAMRERPGRRCLLQKELGREEYWLEIMPRDASKAIAEQKLKQMTGCGRLVVFGDGLNDLELFKIADEAYATADAVPELKAAATGIIGLSKESGVTRWLQEHAGGQFRQE